MDDSSETGKHFTMTLHSAWKTANTQYS